MKVSEILEHKKVYNYIVSHNLLLQYKKAKNLILSWDLKSVDFRKRRPYKSEKFYFKINNKYRAFCFFEWNTLKIFEINDHQD
jgi:hypothetical protein